MLLYQWGTYDWGEGKYFQIDITRQFILGEGKMKRRFPSFPLVSVSDLGLS